MKKTILYWEDLAEWFRRYEKHMPSLKQIKKNEEAFVKSGLVKRYDALIKRK